MFEHHVLAKAHRNGSQGCALHWSTRNLQLGYPCACIAVLPKASAHASLMAASG